MKSYKQFKENINFTNAMRPVNDAERIKMIEQGITNISASLIGLNGKYYSHGLNVLISKMKEFEKEWVASRRKMNL